MTVAQLHYLCEVGPVLLPEALGHRVEAARHFSPAGKRED
jgi:hypothetical protein